MNKINSHFDKDHGILIIRSEGEIFAEMIINLYEKIADNKEYPRDLKLLIHTPKSNFNLRPKQMQEFAAKSNRIHKVYNSLKKALVVEGTFNTMMATLYSIRSNKPNFQVKVFSTEVAALNWLNE